MASAYNLDGTTPSSPPPPSMKKRRMKKKETETTAGNSDRRRRPRAERSLDRCVHEMLIEAVKLAGMLLEDCYRENNSGRRKRRKDERSDAADRRAYKEIAKIKAKEAREKQLELSEVNITFDKADCKDISDLSGRNPIVVRPVIFLHWVHDVLMDGGSSLNIITAETLDKMQISRSDIGPVTRSFEGVVSGITVTSIGQIWLSVQLGKPENFRREDVLFDVADDVEIPFNAILGRPAIAKFMAVLHHAYQCVKIPGPNGVITLPSSGSGGHL
jgi:hypothetical protein